SSHSHRPPISSPFPYTTLFRSSPMVDARLPDGSRVNAIIPPLAVDGPIVSIRRFPAERLKAEDLVTLRALTQPMLDFLAHCVKRSEEHTSELQSRVDLVCRLLL